jgi:hypothetical protein
LGTVFGFLGILTAAMGSAVIIFSSASHLKNVLIARA